MMCCTISLLHDDVIKWKHFPRYWPFVRGIHRGPVNSPHKGQWRGALMFSLICVWINGWVNNGEAGELRRNHAHYDVITMLWWVGTVCYASLWFVKVYNGLLWLVMLYHCFMRFLYFIMVRYHFLGFIMVWYDMVYYGLVRFLMIYDVWYDL